MKQNKPSKKAVRESNRARTAKRRERESVMLERLGFQSVEGLMGALLRGEVAINKCRAYWVLENMKVVIYDGHGPALGELKPSVNLVDEYYQKLVNLIVEYEKEGGGA